MIYDIQHVTTYTYEEHVSLSNHLARLTPRQLPMQNCLSHEIKVEPEPQSCSEHEDYFGNRTIYFALNGVHRSLVVTTRSRVEVQPDFLPVAASTPAWEILREACRANTLTEDAQAGEFTHPSPFIKLNAEYASYAAHSFLPGRPVLEAAMELNGRIFREFKFDGAATDVATPLEEVFKKRRGVCQDFAHIYIACVRSLGLPARYVSGYLETLPPPGKTKLVGADASHAWTSVWCGAEYGWVELDPTNNCIPQGRHIRVAYGRDFADVSPLRGIVYGHGGQELKVAVDVTTVPPASLTKGPSPSVPAPAQSQTESR